MNLTIFQQFAERVERLSIGQKRYRTERALAKLNLKRTKPNKSLLLRLARKFESMRHVKHYNQAMFLHVNECGTAACIAGWVLLDAGLTPVEMQLLESFSSEYDIGSAARSHMGLDTTTAGRLFSGSSCSNEFAPDTWPQRFQDEWNETNGKERNLVAAKVLRSIVKNNGKLE